MDSSNIKSDDTLEETLQLWYNLCDADIPIAFNCKRHKETIEGGDTITQTWRMKERMKTVSVALVICLNVGVDPPDIVKTQPCARLECWIDPLTMGATRALEAIGNNLQKQYERWQPRARYKQSLDPTVEEVKKLCTSLRRNAKEERVLFHYNGHGVPKPTANGEIWVFNRMYTQYIPLSVYDLQTWMGAPSIYVYDCSNAGIIVDLFKQFATQHEQEYEQMSCQNRMSTPPPSYKNCIQLASCAADEILPMHPDLPADMFTSCLTTPIKIALRWFVMQNSARLVPAINLESIDKIPGQLSDRRTMLGELNWIFTAVTDTIAWNTLPRELFQKLFRQDLLVASLFRNFLLAERIMHSYNCNPVSWPCLPPTHQHPMWAAWDLALDLSLSNLPAVLESEDNFRHSPFFQDQLTAFQVSITLPLSLDPPTQLPIVLQVLLSQVHRLRALELLGRYLDLGPSAVNMALSVGIFPYVLKLLQSSAKELRPLLVFIWAKILAVDSTCQADLVRDNGHKYFLSILQDPTMSSEDRTLATFVLACMVDGYEAGQEAALQGSLVSICLEQLNDPSPVLRQWLAICLGRLWKGYDNARWIGVRDQAHDKLYLLLKDSIPEVRAAAVFALGTFIDSTSERSEHANSIDQGVAMTLLTRVSKDMSPLVRQELIVSLQCMILVFENSFLSVALQEMREGNQVANLATGVLHSPVSTFRRNPSKERSKTISVTATEMFLDGRESMKRVPSATSINSLGNNSTLPTIQFGSFYHKMWSGLTSFDNDPFPAVSIMSRKITEHIREQLCAWPGQTSPHKDDSWPVSLTIGHLNARESRDHNEGKSNSLPPSPSNINMLGDSPPKPMIILPMMLGSGKKHKSSIRTINEDSSEENNNSKRTLVSTQFVQWSCKYFAEPFMTENNEKDLESPQYSERQWRFKRNSQLRMEACAELSENFTRIENVLFTTRLNYQPHQILFHPYENHLAIAYKDTVTIWDYINGCKLWSSMRTTGRGSRVTSIEFINAHDGCLTAAACDDGTIRVWAPSEMGGQGKLVSAWQALQMPIKPSSYNPVGTVMCWDQWRMEFLVGGDPRHIKIWDADKEFNTAEIPTGSDHPVTSISIDPTGGHHLVAVGCGDGTVRLFDRRIAGNESRVLTYRDHTGRVVNISFKESFYSLISGSTGGDVRMYDTRKSQSVLACQISHGMKAMAVHRYGNIFACGSSNQISIYKTNERMNSTASLSNVIKSFSNEWFSNSKFGPISCLAFHNYRLLLAAGSSDNSIYVYTVDPKR